MKNYTLIQQVVLFLKDNPHKRFTAREIAIQLVKIYPDYYKQKRLNSQQRFTSENSFISQIVAEIGSRIKRLKQSNAGILIQDQPRPRVYEWKGNSKLKSNFIDKLKDEENAGKDILNLPLKKMNYTEADLYPLLIEYLGTEYSLKCDRINEKFSKKGKGENGNKWLHPDIVALQAVTEDWNSLVKTCVQSGDAKMAYLWSFEVKKQISRSTVRQYFFQAVSNSSWANYGYLVSASIPDDGTMNELRMLSALHGIGLIILKTDNVIDSQIMIPAAFRAEVDWCSVNRLVEENADMRLFIQKVASYYKSGLLQKTGWSNDLLKVESN